MGVSLVLKPDTDCTACASAAKDIQGAFVC